MTPTKTKGLCGYCREANPYTALNCARCGTRLAWAFLIDGDKKAGFDTKVDEFVGRVLGALQASASHEIACRFCRKTITADTIICPHCANWLGDGHSECVTRRLVDPQAPEIRRLLKLSQKRIARVIRSE